MIEITLRQQEVLNYISDYTNQNVYPPTVREIAAHFNIAIKAVQDHLTALQKKGYITVSQKHSRSIALVKDAAVNPFSPFITRVPLLADKMNPVSYLLETENIAGYIVMSEPFVKKDKEYFIFNADENQYALAEIVDKNYSVKESDSAVIYKNGKIYFGNLNFLENNQYFLLWENEKMFFDRTDVAGIIKYKIKKL